LENNSQQQNKPGNRDNNRSGGGGGGGGRDGGRRDNNRSGLDDSFEEKVLYINRVAKVVKGGKRFSFSALVVAGDRNGKVGIGLGKANEVPEAIKKASKQARKNMITVPITSAAKSIPHDVLGKFCSGRVLMKPAVEGTGVIASATVRGILEAAGLQNVRTKTLRSRNPHNVVKATIDGLKQLRSFETMAAHRNKTVAEIL
jgi:small subunit ribosomal protein S5